MPRRAPAERTAWKAGVLLANSSCSDVRRTPQYWCVHGLSPGWQRGVAQSKAGGPPTAKGSAERDHILPLFPHDFTSAWIKAPPGSLTSRMLSTSVSLSSVITYSGHDPLPPKANFLGSVFGVLEARGASETRTRTGSRGDDLDL